jgi:hypothetical protein
VFPRSDTALLALISQANFSQLSQNPLLRSIAYSENPTISALALADQCNRGVAAIAGCVAG